MDQPLARGLLVAALLPLALVGCKKLKTGAAEKFSQDYTCPESRVEVIARPDLSPAQVLGRSKAKVEEPPDDVKNDPERYALWKEEQKKQEEKDDGRYDNYEVFEAKGCDHDVIYACCHAAQSSAGHSGSSDVVLCDESAASKQEKDDAKDAKKKEAKAEKKKLKEEKKEEKKKQKEKAASGEAGSP